MQAYEAYSDPKNNDIKSEMRTRDEFAKTFARSSMKARLSRRSFSSSSWVENWFYARASNFALGFYSY